MCAGNKKGTAGNKRGISKTEPPALSLCHHRFEKPHLSSQNFYDMLVFDRMLIQATEISENSRAIREIVHMYHFNETIHLYAFFWSHDSDKSQSQLASLHNLWRSMAESFRRSVTYNNL